MIKLTPLDVNTPQDAFAKRLANLLADEPPYRLLSRLWRVSNGP